MRLSANASGSSDSPLVSGLKLRTGTFANAVLAYQLRLFVVKFRPCFHLSQRSHGSGCDNSKPLGTESWMSGDERST
jgi:hypothetical protein